MLLLSGALDGLTVEVERAGEQAGIDRLGVQGMTDGLFYEVRLERLSMDVSCRSHPMKVLRAGLDAFKIVTASKLKKLPSGSRVRLSGMVVFFRVIVKCCVWHHAASC